MNTSDNRACLALVLRTSAQIQLHSWTSDALGTLSAIVGLRKEEDSDENTLRNIQRRAGCRVARRH